MCKWRIACIQGYITVYKTRYIASKNTQKEDAKYCWTFGYNERAKTHNIHYW